MTRVALAGLLGRKLRTALTAIAIVLGVAMVTGTFVLTDSIDKAPSTSIFTDVRTGLRRVVTGKAAFDAPNSRARPRRPFAESLLDAGARPAGRRATPRAASAARRTCRPRTARRSRSAARRTSASASIRAALAVQPADARRRQPGRAGDEVVIDNEHRGQEAPRGRRRRSASRRTGRCGRCRISGLVKFGGASSLGGATLAGFDLPTAQTLFDKHGPARRDRDRDASPASRRRRS